MLPLPGSNEALLGAITIIHCTQQHTSKDNNRLLFVKER